MELVLRALDFEVVGVELGRPKMTWKRQVEEPIEWIRPKKEDDTNRKKWFNAVYKLPTITR